MSAAFDFHGRQVVVTGASRGIGLAVAAGFAAAGADLLMLADDAEVIAAAATLGRDSAGTVRGVRCDITDRAAVAQALARYPRIDILVNNAGFERMTPMAAAGEEVEQTFRRIIDTNVIGTYYVTREALARIPEGGRIIITASIWGKTAEAGFAAYCSSKHANIGFMRTLARELGPRGITVNALCPGWVRTEASMRSLQRMSEQSGEAEAQLLAQISAAQALPGLMVPEDVVGPYLFLASAAAGNVTGQALNVDRGEVMA